MKGFIFTIIVILCCILLYLNLSLSYRKNKIKRIEYIKASIDIDQINGFLSILNDSKFSTLGKKYIIILPEEVCERCGSKEKFLNIVKYINIGAELNILTQYFNSTEYNILRRHALNFPDNINLYYNNVLVHRELEFSIFKIS